MNVEQGVPISGLPPGRNVQPDDLFVAVQDGQTVKVTGAQAFAGIKFRKEVAGNEVIVLFEEHGIDGVSKVTVLNPQGFEVSVVSRILSNDVQLLSLVSLDSHTIILE